ncbi:MAG: hypothetical protein OXF22_07085 [Anaerolineaceae bacterium]|nr:hypothetical protein [Anaerolineaceae bacterium]
MEGNYRLALVEGKEQFNQERFQAAWEETIARLRGRPRGLAPYLPVVQRLPWHTEHERGIREVPLRSIVGSVNRAHQFTAQMRPRSDLLRERWSRVYAAALSSQGLPPIELYQYGDAYYVRDGHHRCSVARALGAREMQAYVTELIGPTAEGGRALR